MLFLSAAPIKRKLVAQIDARGPRRRAGQTRTSINVAHDAGLRGNLGAGTNMQMSGDADLPSDQNEIAERG
ncbi:MAG: hypothetical protein JOZ16_03550, partial [Methylobacteriaceae bacterium]|nr:hypothetical protein [Methylobacteriaceae bacterium]